MRIVPTMERIAGAGVTQKSLAERAGMHPLALTHWSQGRRSPTKRSRNKLAAALEATARELLAIAAELRG